MRSKRFFLILSLFLFVYSFARPVLASAKISARHAIVIDGNSGEVLFEKDAHARVPMASTTKIMTALAVLEALPLTATVSVPAEAVGTEGSSAYLKAGELLSVEDLLHALLLQSANDAAVTLAIAADGSVAAFADRMNRMALALGLSQTHFDNPHGLDSDAHYTTAYDLALLSAYAMHTPTFAAIVAKKSYTCRSSLTLHSFSNHNKLLRLSPYGVGVKTGFTRKSGRCLVGAAKKDDALLISVTLNAPDDWQDHLSLWRLGFSTLGIDTEQSK